MFHGGHVVVVVVCFFYLTAAGQESLLTAFHLPLVFFSEFVICKFSFPDPFLFQVVDL